MVKKAMPGIRGFKLSDLNPAKYNPRKISDDALEGLRWSIGKFGCVEPIVVNIRNGKNTIVGGHQRYKILCARGKVKEYICVTVDLSDKDERLLNLTLNNPEIQGAFIEDIEKYIGELRADIGDEDYFNSRIADLRGDIEGTGGLTDPDAVPDLPAAGKVITKKGDLWSLGDHRLLCGDCIGSVDVGRLLGKERADMVFTDPPYNVDYTGQRDMKIKNDKMAAAAFSKFLQDAFLNFYNYMEPGAAIYICHADTEGFNFRSAFNKAGFHLSGCLIWKKPALVLGRSDYQWQHEPILYGWRSPGKHLWNGGRCQTTILNGTNVISQISKTEYLIKTAIGEICVSGSKIKFSEIPTTIIEIDKPKSNKDHPTMKPVRLISRFLNNSSKKGDRVLDLFLGSGSTLIACEKTNRRCFGMEIDPVYCDVIVKRWEEFTGKKAKRVKK